MSGIPDAGDAPALPAPESTLHLSEERYRALFEESDDALYVLDLAGRLTDVNRAAERMLNYTRAELLSLSIGDLVPEARAVRKRDDPLQHVLVEWKPV